MRLRAIPVLLAFVTIIFQTGCGTNQRMAPTQPTFFDTHEVFYAAGGNGLPAPDRIYGYQVDKSTGVPAPVSGSPFVVADASANQYVSKVGPIDPGHRFVVAAVDLGFGNGEEIELFQIDPENGSLTLTSKASVPRLVIALTLDSTARFLYVSADSLNGNSILAFRIDGANLTKIAELPVPFEADFPQAVANPRKPLLHVYGTTTIDLGNLNVDLIQHITSFRIDPVSGLLTPTNNTYVGDNLPFLIVGMDGTGNYLFGEDSNTFREFAVRDDGSMTELAGNAVPLDPTFNSAITRVVGNSTTNVLYVNKDGGKCQIALGHYDVNSGAISVSDPGTNCQGEVQLAEATPNFLFGTFPPVNALNGDTTVFIYRLDPSGAIISQSNFSVF